MDAMEMRRPDTQYQSNDSAGVFIRDRSDRKRGKAIKTRVSVSGPCVGWGHQGRSRPSVLLHQVLRWATYIPSKIRNWAKPI